MDDDDDDEDSVTPSTSVADVPLRTEEKAPLTNSGILDQKDLEPYRKDPFWVRLRFVCLSTFWVSKKKKKKKSFG